MNFLSCLIKGVLKAKLGRYKIFHNDSDTIRYRINDLKVGIFDIDTKFFLRLSVKIG